MAHILQQLLLQKNLLTLEDLENIDSWTSFGPVSFLEKVWRTGLVKDDVLIELLSNEFDVKDGTKALAETPPSSGALGALSRELAEEHRALPLAVDPAKITIGMLDPLNTAAVSNIRAYCFLPIEVQAVKASELFSALSQLYDIEEIKPSDRNLFRKETSADEANDIDNNISIDPLPPLDEPSSIQPAEELSKDEMHRASIVPPLSKDPSSEASDAILAAVSSDEQSFKNDALPDATQEIQLPPAGMPEYEDAVDVSLGSLSGEGEDEPKEEWSVSEPARTETEESTLVDDEAHAQPVVQAESAHEPLQSAAEEPLPEPPSLEESVEAFQPEAFQPESSEPSPALAADAEAMAEMAFPSESLSEPEPLPEPPATLVVEDAAAFDVPDVVDEHTLPQVSSWGDAISDEENASVMPLEQNEIPAENQVHVEQSEAPVEENVETDATQNEAPAEENAETDAQNEAPAEENAGPDAVQNEAHAEENAEQNEAHAEENAEQNEAHAEENAEPNAAQNDAHVEENAEPDAAQNDAPAEENVEPDAVQNEAPVEANAEQMQKAEPNVLSELGDEFRSALLFSVEANVAQLSASSVLLQSNEIQVDLNEKSAFQRAFQMGNVAAGTRLAPSDVEKMLFAAIHSHPPSTFAVFPVGKANEPNALLYVDTESGMLSDAQISRARRFAMNL